MGGKGVGVEGSQSQQTAQSQATGETFIGDPTQQMFRNQLAGSAAGLAGQQLGGIGQVAFPLAGGLLGQGQGALGGLGGLSQQLAQFGGGLGQGQQQLGQVSAPGINAPQLGESAVDPLIGALGNDFTTFLNRQIGGAGGINTEAALAGNLGGGRNQVAQGIAIGDAARAFGTQAAGIRQADLAQRQQLGAQVGIEDARQQLQAQQFNVGTQFNENQLLQQGQLGGAQLGLAGFGGQLDSLQGLFNLGISPFGAQFGPLQMLASILGDPTILSRDQQTSRSQGTSESFGFSLGAG